MTQPGSRPANPAPAPSLNLRGAVDLSTLKNARPAAAPPGGTGAAAPTSAGPGAEPGDGTPSYAVDVNEESFQELIQLSAQVPVVVSLGASWSAASASLNATLESIIGSYSGRMVLARVDAETSPGIAQAFGAEAVPTAVALLKGRPVPLFEGELSEQQIRGFLEELLKVAAANGVDGALGGAAAAEEPPLPPLHQAALEAIEAGDYAGAAANYRKALAEMPADADAKAGLAQSELLERTAAITAPQAEELRRRAADDPSDLDAALAVADVDVTGGHVEDAFARLVAFIGAHFGPERETVRVRLLDLFEVVGIADPRVSAARQKLARVLF
ncbi:MAG: tetratricopeptide repeat protein [Actinomycetales bacterium]